MLPSAESASARHSPLVDMHTLLYPGHNTRGSPLRVAANDQLLYSFGVGRNSLLLQTLQGGDASTALHPQRSQLDRYSCLLSRHLDAMLELIWLANF